MKYPPEYATMSYSEQARWHAHRAEQCARVRAFLAVVSLVLALSSIAIMALRG